MKKQSLEDAVQNCESALREYRDYCVEKNIYKSCVTIADRLLERRIELVELYQEVDRELKSAPVPLYMFFDSVLLSSGLWNPEENKKARLERDELEEINKQIATTAEHLANLIDQRTELNNTSGFSSETHYGVCETLDAAAGANHSYNGWVKDKFKQLYSRFDLKYWPTISEFILELARDAKMAEINPSDQVTAAATTGSRASLKDYVRALETHIKQNHNSELGSLQSIFQLSDGSIASLVNCVLDLEPNDMKDAGYVKKFRQVERERHTGTMDNQ